MCYHCKLAWLTFDWCFASVFKLDAKCPRFSFLIVFNLPINLKGVNIFWPGKPRAVREHSRPCTVISIDKYVMATEACWVVMDVMLRVGVGVWCVCVEVWGGCIGVLYEDWRAHVVPFLCSCSFVWFFENAVYNLAQLFQILHHTAVNISNYLAFVTEKSTLRLWSKCTPS